MGEGVGQGATLWGQTTPKRPIMQAKGRLKAVKNGPSGYILDVGGKGESPLTSITYTTPLSCYMNDFYC